MDGVGGQYPGATKRCVEQQVTLTTSWMLQNNYFDLPVNCKSYGHTIGWSRPAYTLTFTIERTTFNEMRLHLRNTGQVVCLVASEMRFGGLRWWFKCPDCFRRCTTLHLEQPGVKFSCRLCLNLTYRSCQESHGFDSIYSELAARMGITAQEVKRQISNARKAHKNRWVRRRDRRPKL